jgi:ATP synthase protein I
MARALELAALGRGHTSPNPMVGAVLVGAAIGYGLDNMLGSKPWLLLLFFVLGFAAGVLNVMRGYTRLQGDIARETGGNIGKDLADNDD